jgi:DNA-binding transcriptional LysR family regulator
MIDLRLLRQFVAVAEELHFHRAAARLHMSQPPLTAAIRRLEDELGSELIVRGNRTLGLTVAGQTLLVEARATLQQAEQALQRTREAAAGQSGSLRVGYVGSALYGRLPGLIRCFRQQYPQVQLHLQEATSRQQQLWLREQRIDVGVLIPPIPATELVLHDFDHDRLAIALPRAHALADAPEVGVALLADEPFVSWPAGEGIGFHAQVLGLCGRRLHPACGAGGAGHACGVVAGGGGGGGGDRARQHGQFPPAGDRLPCAGKRRRALHAAVLHAAGATVAGAAQFPGGGGRGLTSPVSRSASARPWNQAPL